MNTTNEWVDTTTRRKSDTDNTPHSWTLDTGKLRISVLNNHIDYPGKWVLHCFSLGINTAVLKAPIETPVDVIQAAAIRIVRRKLDEMVSSLPA